MVQYRPRKQWQLMAHVIKSWSVEQGMVGIGADQDQDGAVAVATPYPLPFLGPISPILAPAILQASYSRGQVTQEDLMSKITCLWKNNNYREILLAKLVSYACIGAAFTHAIHPSVFWSNANSRSMAGFSPLNVCQGSLVPFQTPFILYKSLDKGLA